MGKRITIVSDIHVPSWDSLKPVSIEELREELIKLERKSKPTRKEKDRMEEILKQMLYNPDKRERQKLPEVAFLHKDINSLIMGDWIE